MMAEEINESNIQSNDGPEICTINECTKNLDHHSLQCLKCQRKVHYQCTLLPLYQIQQIINFGVNYRKFTCRNCVTIQDDLREILSSKPSVETLQFELETQRTLVRSYADELSELKETLKKYEKEYQDNPAKKRKRNQNDDIMLQNEMLNIEIRQLRQESKTLKTLLDERETTLDETLTKLNEWEEDPKTLNQNQILKEMQNIMNNRIDQMENNIEDIIERKIVEKQHINKDDEKSTFAETLRKNWAEDTVEKAIKITKNNEKIQETERAKRERNLIIHGISEPGITEKKVKKNDHDFIKSFLEIIGVNVKPNSITRIGKTKDGKMRPVKLVMGSISNKDLIMSRLVNLKNADEQFKAISVRDDYTIEERELIKLWHQKAEERNRNEKTNVWKVRGTPKNGLRIVRVTKRKEIQQQFQSDWATGSFGRPDQQ